MPAGRPTDYRPEIADEICHRMGEGESLSAICRDAHLPSRRTVQRWLLATETILPDIPKEFRRRYAQAKTLRAEKYADEIVEIADGAAVAAHVLGEEAADEAEEHKADVYRRVYNEEIQARRLRIDSRKWFAARCDPSNWGEKHDLNVGGQRNNPVEHRKFLDTSRLTPEKRSQLEALVDECTGGLVDE